MWRYYRKTAFEIGVEELVNSGVSKEAAAAIQRHIINKDRK